MLGRKNVLDELYYGNINESERLLGKLAETEEYKQYRKITDEFVATLSKQQATLFNEFFLASSGYESVYLKRTYTNGVKLGMALVLELIDFDPSFQPNDLEK